MLITHEHRDHLDVDRVVGLLESNPDAQVVGDEASSGKLAGAGVAAQTVHDGDEIELGGVSVRACGSEHAVIHPDVPVPPNVGYLVAQRFFYPGDAFTPLDEPVDVLGLPAGAPWLKVREAIDYLRAVKPRVVVPMHEAVLAKPEMHYRLFRDFSEEQDTHVPQPGRRRAGDTLTAARGRSWPSRSS